MSKFNKPKFDKPYKNTEELLQILKNRNLNLVNDGIAKNLLQLYGYYPLINGYNHPLIKTNNLNSEIYINHSNLGNIYSLYLIDSEFQELFLTNVLKIEKHFANTLGNEVASNFGVDHHNKYLEKLNSADSKEDIRKAYKSEYYSSPGSYLDKKNYVGKKIITCLKGINKAIYKCKDDPISFYKKKHNHIPPWILVQNLTFGMVTNYYKIQQPKIKTKIVDEMITSKDDNEDKRLKKNLFLSELQILSFFRNIAAHSSPIYLFRISKEHHYTFNYPSKKSLKYYLGNQIFEDTDPDSLGTNDLYAALLALLLLNRDGNQRDLFLDKLYSLENKFKNNLNYIKDYQNYIYEAGLPTNYVERLFNASKKLIYNEYSTCTKEYKDIDGQIHIKKENFLKHPLDTLSLMKKVYVSKSGNRYHLYKDCSYLNGKTIKYIPITEAMDNNLTSCKKCQGKAKK